MLAGVICVLKLIGPLFMTVMVGSKRLSVAEIEIAFSYHSWFTGMILFKNKW
jgi:hypothetical protein